MDRDERLVKFYAQGYSLRETAKHFGVSMQRVHQILRKKCAAIIRVPHDTRQNSTGLAAPNRHR